MDLETENRIATILLKEARELRQQADREGALAYLREPTVRSRPNSRFLTATVLGVQQANRSVEVNEMWRLRDKQLELENRVRNRNGSVRRYEDGYDSHSRRSSSHEEREPSASGLRTCKKRSGDDLISTSDEGLRDEDIEEFLHSRAKRGRGAIGSRMDEAGPYLPSCPGSTSPDYEPRKARVLGPERPVSLKRRESSDDESDDESLKDEKKSTKKHSSKHRSSKHKSKSKSKDERRKKRRDEKKRKHRR